MREFSERVDWAAKALDDYGMEPMAGMASAARREDAFRSAAVRVLHALGLDETGQNPGALEVRVQVLVVGEPPRQVSVVGAPGEAFRVAQDALATLAKRNGGGDR